jgi:hypothetical protein
VASVTPRYDQLGDDCDFLTIAGDWPYRFDNDAERGLARGILALDDLIGRKLEGKPDARGLNASRRRWAYTGRLLGDAAASVAHAMGALFLQPSEALLWDTYKPEPPWSSYSLVPTVDRLGRSRIGSGGIFLRSDTRADLVSWHRAVDPLHRFGFIWVNSSGPTPQGFAIPGGPGRPADVPGGFPAAVVMIHSFSAARPADPQTIAGRWLDQGAFVYFGSVNEPYLHAFRPARLVVDLAAAGVPLAAALRQFDFEPFGRPWRLIYLGDPLYQLIGAPRASDRLSPRDWQETSGAYKDWPVAEVIAGGPSPHSDPDLADDGLLRWCQDAAIGELVASRPAAGRGDPPAEPRRLEWRSVLGRIRRDRLDPGLRPAYEDLLIDAMRESGAFDELQSRLARIPADERRPRVWQALESGAMSRLARLAKKGDSAPELRASPRSLGRGHPPLLAGRLGVPRAAHRTGLRAGPGRRLQPSDSLARSPPQGCGRAGRATRAVPSRQGRHGRERPRRRPDRTRAWTTLSARTAGRAAISRASTRPIPTSIARALRALAQTDPAGSLPSIQSPSSFW